MVIQKILFIGSTDEACSEDSFNILIYDKFKIDGYIIQKLSNIFVPK